MTQSKPLTTYCRFFEGVPAGQFARKWPPIPHNPANTNTCPHRSPSEGLSDCCRREANNSNYCGSSTPGDDRQKHTSAAHESGVALSLCGLSRKRVLKRLFRLVVVRWAKRAHDTRKEVHPRSSHWRELRRNLNYLPTNEPARIIPGFWRNLMAPAQPRETIDLILLGGERSDETRKDFVAAEI